MSASPASVLEPRAAIPKVRTRASEAEREKRVVENEDGEEKE